MKIFRYELGHNAMETMTVGELIKYLKDFPEEMPVLAQWEGCHNPLNEAAINPSFHTGKTEDACDVLVFDVNNY